MRLLKQLAPLLFALLSPATADAQIEADIQTARRTMAHQQLAFPDLWERMPDGALRHRSTNLVCAESAEGFVLSSIRASSNSAMCQWAEPAENLLMAMVTLPKQGQSLMDMVDTATQVLVGFPEVSAEPVTEELYHGCVAVVLRHSSGTARSHIFLADLGGHYRIMMAGARRADGSDLEARFAKALATVETYASAQTECEALG